jgi:MFS family permease
MGPQRPPLDRRSWYYGWNIIAVCVVAQLSANGLPINTFSLFLHNWSADLHAPISSLQLAMAMLATMTAFAAPIIGGLADRFPARWLIGAGLLGMAAFCFGVSSASAAWQLLALYACVLPITLNLSTSIVTTALVSRWFRRKAGLAFGLTAFGVGMAGVLTPPLIAAAMPLIGWRGVWRVAALLLALVVAPLAMMLLRDRPTEREGLHYIDVDAAELDGAQLPTGVASALRWREVLGRRNFWLLIAVFVPILAAYGGCAYNLAPIAARHGLGPKAASALLSVFSLSHVVSTLGLGLLSDRFGNRLPWAGLAIVTAAGALLLGVSQSLLGLVVAVAMVGLAGGLWTLVTASIAVEFGAPNVGRAFGLTMAFVPIQALSPFAIAKVQESTGAYTPALAGLAALVLVGGGVSLLMRERRLGHPTTAAKYAALEDVAIPLG